MEEKDEQNMTNADVIIMLEVQKLILKKFYSNPLEWKLFQDTYGAAIEENEQRSAGKFSYLRSYLEVKTLQAIEGFPLTSNN